MVHTMKGFCILILVSIAPTALAYTIERTSLVWLCPATGFVHSNCNNYIADNPPVNYQLREGCKLTREGSQNPGGILLKNETDLLINLNGDTDHDIYFNVVGLSNQYYCLYNAGLFKSWAGVNLSGQDVGGTATDCETYSSGGGGPN